MIPPRKLRALACAFALATLAVTAILYGREFHSEVLRVLKD